MAALSLSTIAAGVPAGAKMPYQGVEPKPGIVSLIAGTLGRAAIRFSLVTAKALILPELMRLKEEGALWTEHGTTGDIGCCRSSPFVRDVLYINAHFLLEHFHDQVVERAITG